jgi:hypothetical protein
MDPLIWIIVIPVALFWGYQLLQFSLHLKEKLLATPKGEPVNPDELWGDYLYKGKYNAFYVGKDLLGSRYEFRVKGITDPYDQNDVLTLTYADVLAYITEYEK